MEKECAFCKQFGIGNDGFQCNKTGRTVNRNDSCSDFEGVE